MNKSFVVVGVKPQKPRRLGAGTGAFLGVMALALMGSAVGEVNQAILQQFGGPLNLRSATAGQVPVKQADGSWAPGAGGGGGGAITTSGDGLSGDGTGGDPLTLDQALQDYVNGGVSVDALGLSGSGSEADPLVLHEVLDALVTAEGAGGEGVADIAGISTAAKGDILVHNGDKWTLLPAGTNGQVATINTGTENYVSWATPAGGTVDPGSGAGGASYMPTTPIGSSTDSSPYDVDAEESGTVFTNVGAVELCEAELPDCQLGQNYYFYVADTDGFKITAVGGNKIVIAGTATSAAGSVTSLRQGDYLHLVATQDTSGAGNHWVAVAHNWSSASAGLGSGDIAVISTDTTITSVYAGKVIVVDGITATTTLTLDAAAVNSGPFTVIRMDSSDLVRLKAASGDDIQLGAAGKCAAGGYWEAQGVGAHMTVKGYDSTSWLSITADGDWNPGS